MFFFQKSKCLLTYNINKQLFAFASLDINFNSVVIVGRLENYTGKKPLHRGYKNLLNAVLLKQAKWEGVDDEFRTFMEKVESIRSKEEEFRRERSERKEGPQRKKKGGD